MGAPPSVPPVIARFGPERATARAPARWPSAARRRCEAASGSARMSKHAAHRRAAEVRAHCRSAPARLRTSALPTIEPMGFVHLRTHTEYSVVDGTLRVADAVRAARQDAQVALAITDLGNLFGAVKFYRACRADGVKPIIGVDLWIEPVAGSGDKQASRLLLLVCDATGYHNLCDL